MMAVLAILELALHLVKVCDLSLHLLLTPETLIVDVESQEANQPAFPQSQPWLTPRPPVVAALVKSSSYPAHAGEEFANGLAPEQRGVIQPVDGFEEKPQPTSFCSLDWKFESVELMNLPKKSPTIDGRIQPNLSCLPTLRLYVLEGDALEKGS